MARYIIGEIDALPPGTRKLLTVGGREIGVFNIDGHYYAVRNRCAHQGGPVCLGVMLGDLTSTGPGDYRLDPTKTHIECPWHGWEYDLTTGESWFDPKRERVRSYPINVESGSDLQVDAVTGLAKGPYAIETFPVAVDREYLVIEVNM